MRRRDLVLAFGVSAACAPGAARATTLEEATAAALADNPLLGSARADYLSSTARIGLAVARGRFQVNLSARATHDFDNDPYAPSIRDETSLRLSLPLWSGGRVRAATAAARLRAVAAADDLLARTDDLRITVAERYDVLLDAEDAVRVQREETDALDRHLAQITGERREGFATRTDAAQGGARLALSRARLEAAAGGREEARIAYRRLVGADAGVVAEPALPAVTGGADQLVDAAVRYSPALRAMDERVRAAARDVAASRALGRPTLALTASASYGNTDMRLAETRRFPHRLFARAGLTLTVPFYLGGQVAAQTARAEALQDQAKAAAEDARRRLVAEVRTGFHAYQGALRRVAAAADAEDASRRALAGVGIEHEAGTRTALDLLNAQREFSENRRAAARARREAHVEAVALLVRTGAYLEARGVVATGSPRAPARSDSARTASTFDLATLSGSVVTPPMRMAAVSGAGGRGGSGGEWAGTRFVGPVADG